VLAGSAVDEPLALQHLAFALMTGSIALRRSAPLAAAVVCGAGLLLQTLAGDAPVVGGFVAMLVVLVSLGYHASTRTGLLGVAAIAAGGLSKEVVTGDVVPGDTVGNVLIVVGSWLLARLLRVNVDHRVAAEVDRDRAAHAAADAERTRIARDLHDSVAHALTVVTLQAGGARELAAEGPVRDALGHVEQTSRQALLDMQRFVRVLGADGAGAPGLADLEPLVERVRATGLDAVLHRDADLDGLAPSVSTAAYRVVQESLTNVLKHAGATHVVVDVRRDARDLRVEVRDDGTGRASRGSAGVAGAAGAEVPGAGRGLPGLVERVGLFGGELACAPAAGGGWQVVATIPVTRDPAVALHPTSPDR
jgi:signal transduction histidine kinase